MGIHDGHRSRIKQRFLQHGADVFDDHQLLELLLFYAIPQGDTNPTAHALLDHFGSLAAVFDAAPADLMKVKGIGEHAALLIHMLPQIMRRYQISRETFSQPITSTRDAGRYLLPYFYGARNECIYLLCLDAKGKVISCNSLGTGSLNMAELDVRRVVSIVLEHRASSVILAHNHTSGVAIPSEADRMSTLALRDVLRAVQVELLDHIVVADEDFVSMRDSGMLSGR